jgi:HEPN domain-containing protein
VTDDLRDYVEKWLFRANEDIAAIDRLIQSDPQAYTSSICFHAQQAARGGLKRLGVCGW